MFLIHAIRFAFLSFIPCRFYLSLSITKDRTAHVFANDKMATDTELEAADALREMLKLEDDNEFKLVEDERKRPAYPLLRELPGFILPRQAKYHPPPLRVKDGVLEDMMYDGNRNEIYKARPLPLRCESCNIECDSYASFTEHCIIPSHKAKLDPSTQFDPRLLDPRYNDPRYAGDVFWAMSSVAKLEALRKYKKDMIDWLNMSCPDGPDDKTQFSQYAAWDRLKLHAKAARDTVKHDAPIFEMSKKELVVALNLCKTYVVFNFFRSTIEKEIEEGGVGEQSYALDLVEHGWAELDFHGSGSWKEFLSVVTGQDY